jgi:hypothetical protein
MGALAREPAMVKATRIELGPDDPIFSEGPTISVPVPRPSQQSTPSVSVEELAKLPEVTRGPLEESMLQQLDRKLSPASSESLQPAATGEEPMADAVKALEEFYRNTGKGRKTPSK